MDNNADNAGARSLGEADEGSRTPLPVDVHPVIPEQKAVVPTARSLVAEAVLHIAKLVRDGARAQKLDEDIKTLQAELADKAKALADSDRALQQSAESAGRSAAEVEKLRTMIETLERKQRAAHLLGRIHPRAEEIILTDSIFIDRFAEDLPRDAYVLSVDLRRSTELMLKAREPKLFAKFMLELTNKVKRTITENYGIFDKFTGDGALAFFPDFYSGKDAGFYAVRAASTCHEVCVEHFRSHRNCFVSVLKQVGLGIGLDRGPVKLVQFGHEFTVVGTPVVYACRMAGAPAGVTYANQPAYEALLCAYAEEMTFIETEIDIKAEGPTVAYATKLGSTDRQPQLPDWMATPPQP